MRIPLTVKTFAEGLKPFASVSFRLQRPHVFGFIEVFVDTGSPWTTLSLRDAERIMGRFLRSRLAKRGKSIHLGGHKLSGHPIKDVVLRFRDGEGKPVNTISPITYILKGGETAKTVPSIIGVDFLQANNFALYFDPCHKKAYLEKV